ncbi:MAG: DUF3088 domain-containing protein [Alphaproteobacteria bacterium]|nr:DUF3088 domain-containing protein [Alphaproteobacteria bacterium]
MSRDIIFLLAPGFEDNDRREYCPECAEIWGVLNYFPAILHGLDIRYQPIARPRAEMVDMLGEEHQNCPTLVLAQGVDAGADTYVKTANGHSFLDNARDIGKYFAHRYGVAVPRGS